MDDALPKFIVLFPLSYNDGREVPKKVLLDFKARLLALANGHTIAGTVEGAYRMADGKTAVDHSLEIWIVLREEYVPELEQLVAELGAELGQESMYLERCGSTVRFIPPRAARGSSS